MVAAMVGQNNIVLGSDVVVVKEVEGVVGSMVCPGEIEGISVIAEDVTMRYLNCSSKAVSSLSGSE